MNNIQIGNICNAMQWVGLEYRILHSLQSLIKRSYYYDYYHRYASSISIPLTPFIRFSFASAYNTIVSHLLKLSACTRNIRFFCSFFFLQKYTSYIFVCWNCGIYFVLFEYFMKYDAWLDFALWMQKMHIQKYLIGYVLFLLVYLIFFFIVVTLLTLYL